MDFKLEGVSGEKSTMYQYEGVDYTGQKNIGVQDKFFLDVGKRTGRGKLDEGAYTRDSRRTKYNPTSNCNSRVRKGRQKFQSLTFLLFI